MPVTNFLWDELNDSYLAETDSTGAIEAEYASEPKQYGRLISQRRGNATSYYHFDGQGSTWQLSNDNQNVTDLYVYTAFGEATTILGNTTNPFQYEGAIGYYSDSFNGSYYVRRRIYTVSVARWLSQDPAFFDSLINRYQYANANPQKATDPSGLLPLIIGRQPYLPNCSCGQAVIKWSIYPPALQEPSRVYLVQKVCTIVRSVECSYDDLSCCSPDKTRWCISCIYELLHDDPKNLRMAEEEFPAPDLWQTPHIRKGAPCISKGAATTFAIVKGTPDKSLITAQNWKAPASPEKCGGLPGIRVGYHLDAEPGVDPDWWQSPRWTHEGANFMITQWDCCPKNQDPHGSMIYGSSTPSVFGSVPCKGGFNDRF